MGSMLVVPTVPNKTLKRPSDDSSENHQSELAVPVEGDGAAALLSWLGPARGPHDAGVSNLKL